MDLHGLHELELAGVQVAAASLNHGDLCVDTCVYMRVYMRVDLQWTRATHCWKAFAEAVILSTGASKHAVGDGRCASLSHRAMDLHGLHELELAGVEVAAASLDGADLRPHQAVGRVRLGRADQLDLPRKIHKYQLDLPQNIYKYR